MGVLSVRYREIQPSPPLRPFIESFWILEQESGEARPQRVVPDGHPELILNWNDPFEYFRDGQWHRQPRYFLAGQISGPLLLRPRGPAHILGIRFRPHGAACVFDAPMHELSGQFTPVSDLAPKLARQLEDALWSPDPVAGIERSVSHFAAAAYDCGIAEAVRQIDLARGALDLAALASRLGISVRQLERRFHASVGLSPKVFCRMQRFMQVFRVFGNETSKWVDAALTCGYYDQAHLIRDFKSFSGETPATLLGEDADLARHFLARFGVSHSSNTRARRPA